LAVFNDTNLTYYSVSEIKYLFSDSYAFLIDGSGASGTPLIPSDVGGKPVRIIGNGAFSPLVRIDATNSDSVLTSITLPGSVISIGDLAFFSCTGLTSITIPDSVTSIGSAAFAHCAKLTSITIPDSVTSMGESSFLDGFFINNYSIYGDYGIFGGCTGLTSISIGNSITRIGDFAFYDCISLASITIPDSVTSIGSGAFSWCTGLTSITIPDSVTSVGSSAFSGSTNLTSVTLPYNFSYSLPSSAVPIYTFDLIIDGLKDDPEFVGAVAQAMLAAENNSGFATKEELPSVEQAGIDQVLAHPASYNLATSAEVANSRTAGQEDILSNPVAYNLYDEASIMEVNVATPLLSMTNAENQAEIEFAIESSDDLQTWTVDERILRTVEGQGDKYFVRVRAGAPYINPGVLVYAHPTLGDILTNAEGYVLYGFSFNSAGQDPTYIGSSWNFVAATATPEADAGVSATLAGATFGNVSDGPWLTVNGLPVYTYPLDTVPYQANGHGIGDVWFTLNPDGSQKP
jgi:predicted lipoprotein with Yx(FWY)xxD motif